MNVSKKVTYLLELNSAEYQWLCNIMTDPINTEDRQYDGESPEFRRRRIEFAKILNTL